MKSWQKSVAVLSVAVWLMSFIWVPSVSEESYKVTSIFLIGYIMGYIVEFILWSGKHILYGQSYKVLGVGRYEKAFSVVSYIVIVTFAVFGIFADIFMNLPIPFALGFFIGEGLSALLFVPFIEWLDS